MQGDAKLRVQKGAETNPPPSPPHSCPQDPYFSQKFSQTANSLGALKVRLKQHFLWNWFMRGVILICVVAGSVMILRVKGESRRYQGWTPNVSCTFPRDKIQYFLLKLFSECYTVLTQFLSFNDFCPPGKNDQMANLVAVRRFWDFFQIENQNSFFPILLTHSNFLG